METEYHFGYITGVAGVEYCYINPSKKPKHKQNIKNARTTSTTISLLNSENNLDHQTLKSSLESSIKLQKMYRVTSSYVALLISLSSTLTPEEAE